MTPVDIKQARASAGLTQSQAAELVGVKLRTWQAWEDSGPNGRTMPESAWRLFCLLTQRTP